MEAAVIILKEQIETERLKLDMLLEKINNRTSNKMILKQSQKLDKLILKFTAQNIENGVQDYAKYAKNTGTC